VRDRKNKCFETEKYQKDDDLLPDPDVSAEDLGLVDDEGCVVDD
jgi:hypothetical protein